MVGHYTPTGASKDAASPMAFTLTVESDDLATMLSNPNHMAKTAGTLTCPALSSQPMTITDGTFQSVRGRPAGRGRAQHELSNDAQLGGRQNVLSERAEDHHAHVAARTVGANRTRCTRRFSPRPSRRAAIGSATLIITPENFLKQQRTLEVTNAPDLKTRLEPDAQVPASGVLRGRAVQRIRRRGRAFVVSRSRRGPRMKRALRAPAPQMFFFDTPDGTRLRLTRYV